MEAASGQNSPRVLRWSNASASCKSSRLRAGPPGSALRPQANASTPAPCALARQAASPAASVTWANGRSEIGIIGKDLGLGCVYLTGHPVSGLTGHPQRPDGCLQRAKRGRATRGRSDTSRPLAAPTHPQLKLPLWAPASSPDKLNPTPRTQFVWRSVVAHCSTIARARNR